MQYIILHIKNRLSTRKAEANGCVVFSCFEHKEECFVKMFKSGLCLIEMLSLFQLLLKE